MNPVEQCLTGLINANEDIALFDFGSVAVQKNYFTNESVRIVSGGSVFFGEFVGEGMLTATVQGESFVAPPSKLILRTLRELSLNHLNGILVVVPGNTGDLLNFGLASERALNDNIQVKLVAVNDNFDKKLPKICRSGLGGVVLVHKIAGSLSQKGKSLGDIYSFCEEVVHNIRSYDVSLPPDSEKIKSSKSITIKTIEADFKRDSDINIHQEICNKIVDEMYQDGSMLEISKNNFNLKRGEEIVVLLNNSGGMSKTDEYIFLKELLTTLESLGVNVARFYSGNFIKCTRNFVLSVTILKIFKAEVLECLDDPCTAPGWKNVNQHSILSLRSRLNGNLIRKDRLAPPIKGPKLTDRVANILLLSTQFACDALISCERQLNIIDSEIGDGDTGTRMKDACMILLKRMKDDKVITNYPYTFFESMSKLLEATVGGTIGCIYSILFEAASYCFGRFCEEDEVTPLMWLKALDAASKALQKYGNIEYGDGTMFDPIYICAETARVQLEAHEDDYIEAFGKGVEAAEDIVQKVKKSRQKYPDSGAHAVGIWMRAVFEAVKLRCPIE